MQLKPQSSVSGPFLSYFGSFFFFLFVSLGNCNQSKMSVGTFNHLEEAESYLFKVKDLLEKSVRFWLQHSHDHQFGGFLNCLSRDGTVYDTTKFGWLQGRQIWTYCHLYTNMECFRTDELLQAAIKGGDFLMKHFKDPVSGKVFFATTRSGEPIKMQRTIFSEVFYIMAMTGLAQVTKKPLYQAEAVQMFRNILKWTRESPQDLGRPLLAGSKPCLTLSVSMCILSLVHEMEDLPEELAVQQDQLDLKEIRSWAVSCIRKHIQRNGSRVLEQVSLDGQELPGFDGRLIQPGHVLECGWFLLKEAERTEHNELKELALKHFIDDPMEYGADKEFGGLFAFIDADGLSPVRLEWNMKLWWVHLEAAMAQLWAHHSSKSLTYWDKFKETFHYISTKFVDEEHGEMFGYVSRQGDVVLDFKGGPYKTCFHVVRALVFFHTNLVRHVTFHSEY